MKKIVFLLYLCSSCLFAQTTQHQIPLQKREQLLTCVQLGSHGFVIQTGMLFSLSSQKTNYTLAYYTAQAEAGWQIQVPGQYKAGTNTNIVVAAPDASYVYNIEGKKMSFLKERQYLTQVTKKGEVKKFELQMTEDYGKEILSVFCDDTYLYYLTTTADKKSDKLVLNRFSHAGLTRKKILLDLPVDTKNAMWSFAGQHTKDKYLVSKYLDPESTTQSMEVVTFDPEGTITQKLSIPYSTEPVYLRPARCTSTSEGLTLLNQGNTTVSNVNFIEGVDNLIYTNSAFGYMWIDAPHNAMYIYGLSGTKPFKKLGPGYGGFYVYKYDLKGSPIWKLQSPGSKELLDVPFYTTHGLPSQRYISLTPFSGQDLVFSISFSKNMSFSESLFLFPVSDKGQAAPGQQRILTSNDAVDWMSTGILTPKAEAYMKMQDKKTRPLYPVSFPTTGGEILLTVDPDYKKLNILFFKE